MTELGLVGRCTTVLTALHPLQIVRTPMPMLAHDIPLGLIVTPGDTIPCRRRYERPIGILWNALPPAKIAELPILAKLAKPGQ